MSVLVYTESEEGNFKKASLEVASYARGVADMLGTSLTAITFNAKDVTALGDHGVEKVLTVNNDKLDKTNNL